MEVSWGGVLKTRVNLSEEAGSRQLYRSRRHPRTREYAVYLLLVGRLQSLEHR